MKRKLRFLSYLSTGIVVTHEKERKYEKSMFVTLTVILALNVFQVSEAHELGVSPGAHSELDQISDQGSDTDGKRRL
jgi:hypothetical protein